MTDKYAHLSRSMDKVINDANMEIQSLQLKVTNIGIDFKSLQQKNTELVELYREKNRKHQQTQHLYDTLKKKFLMNNVQTAASETVNHTLQSISSRTRPETYNGMPNMTVHGVSDAHHHRSQISKFDNGIEQLHTHQKSGSSNHGSDVGAMPPPQLQMRASQRSQNINTGTPMHRAPLGQPISSTPGHASRSHMPTTTERSYHTGYPGSAQRTSMAMRQEFPAPTGRSATSNYGIQAGMKVGAIPGGGPFVQRPASHAENSFVTGSLQTGVYSRDQQTGNNIRYVR